MRIMKTRLEETNKMRKLIGLPLLNEQLNTKAMSAINYAIGQVQHKPEYFQKNPQGVMTLDFYLTPTSINNSKGIDGYKWNDVWEFSHGGRGQNNGTTGKFDYQYKDGKIYIKPSKGNNDVSYGGAVEIDKDGNEILPDGYFELK